MEKRLIIPILLLLINTLSFGQDGVGIGITTPHPSSILHVDAPGKNKGILFPVSTNALIKSIITPKDGLFIYDSIYHRHAYFKNGAWTYATPWNTEVIQSDRDITHITTPYSVGIGQTVAPAVELEVNGDVRADSFDGYGVVPIGGIIMWSGSEDDIPDNFQLCDGGTKNGRTAPNLVGRFIRGARDGNGEVTGGSNTISTTQISYIETPQYTINSTNCQTFRFQYSFTYLVSCPNFEPPEEFPGSATIAASSCAQAQASISEPGCNVSGFSDCTQSSNPNYYLTNPDCFNPDVDVVDAVTGTDNRPTYYDLAFIMRVE